MSIIYIEQKNIEDAEMFAKEIGVNAFYKGLDIEIANTCNKCLVEFFNDMPSLQKKVQVIGNGQLINKEFKKALNIAACDHPDKEQIIKKYIRRITTPASAAIFPYKQLKIGVYKVINDFLGIYISSRTMNNYREFNEEYNEDIKNNYAPAGLENKGVKAVIDHEIGHIIDYSLKVYKNPKIIKIFRETDVAAEVSDYATTNIHEFIAECYAEYKNSDNPRRVACEVAGIMIKQKSVFSRLFS